MKIVEIVKQLETTDRIEYEGKCHDCEKDVKVCIFRDDKGVIAIEGGAVYNPVINDTKQLFFKCDNCFAKDNTLRKWRQIDVYSRVVGYIRPVSGWNKGKREEFKQRKEFVIGATLESEKKKKEVIRDDEIIYRPREI